MKQIIPLQLDDGTIIYVQAEDSLPVADVTAAQAEPTRELTRDALQKGAKGPLQDQALKSFKLVEGTIRAYTQYTLNAFRGIATANVDKVKIEFGINISGKAGIPYVSQGEAESNLKITVECSFPTPHPPGDRP
ncbi:MAG: hypothetical protein HC890_19300 [Chloroflexaceae bacterium]|nr:hypothetical protein [Chloroflexaceae bacterium]